MVQKDKLVQLYFSEYKESAKKLKKKNTDGKKTYERRIRSLSHELQNSSSKKITQVRLEDYHRQIRNLSYYAFRQDNQIAVMRIRDFLLPELVRLDLALLDEEEQEIITTKFLDYLRTEMPGKICIRTLRDLCRHYSEYGVRGQIIDLVPTRPEMEFPEAQIGRAHV